MSNCINTVFNTRETSTTFEGALEKLYNFSPALSIFLSIPLAVIKRVVIILQHIARVILGPFLPLHKLERIYNPEQHCAISCGNKIGLWLKDIGSLLLSPIFLLKDAGQFALYATCRTCEGDAVHPSETGLYPEV